MVKPLIGIGSDVNALPGKSERAFAPMTYIESLQRAGAIPIVIPPQPDNADRLVEKLDGIIFAGGPDCDPAVYGEQRHASVEPMDERRQSNELALARAARKRGIPALGICLGMQVMNVANGGSLVQDIATQLKSDIRHDSDPSARSRHAVVVDDGTQLASIVGAGEMDVNSSHHQAVRNVAEGLRVTAHAPDGIIEGLEDPKHPFYIGVQWHPEDMKGEESASRLFAAFVDAARRYAGQKRGGEAEASPAGVTGKE